MANPKATRYYDDKGFLIGYADQNYCFVRENDSEGNMIGYANSKGEKQGTCKDREICKRFLPNGYGVDYKDFWVAADCPKFEAKARVSDEPSRTEW